MRIKILIASILAIILFSCKNQSNINQSQITKDSLLNKYLAISNAKTFFDASEASILFLKAYNSNDTDALKRICELAESISKEIGASKYDSCINLTDLKELKVDEAYRFSYWQAFCDNSLNITITKKDSIFKIHYISFRGWIDENNKINCSITNEFDKLISIIDWEKFKKMINHSDFWTLNQVSQQPGGTDGNGVTVSGYIKGDINRPYNKTDKFHMVYRWWIDGTDLVNPFLEIVKLSGKKSGCP